MDPWYLLLVINVGGIVLTGNINMWFLKKKEVVKSPPKKYNVGKAHVAITSLDPIDGDSKTTSFMFVGVLDTHVDYDFDISVYIISAKSMIKEWLKHGKYGTLSVLNNRYINISRVVYIDIKYENYLVEEGTNV